MRRIERENTGKMVPGQDLVVAGYAGLSGSLYLLAACGEELSRRLSAVYLNEMRGLDNQVIEKDENYWATTGATEWESCGLGGILRAIWDLTGAYKMGVEFVLRRIPIRQETIEVCECLSCNPYRLYSGGCWLLTADNGGKLVRRLADDGIPSAVIGQINCGIAREVIQEDGRGFLERPHKDEIFQKIPDFRVECTKTHSFKNDKRRQYYERENPGSN
ncbi:MAG: AIR synthase [Clostridiales bacterium]|nr:AIR synthase [Clostridiales bacterium]